MASGKATRIPAVSGAVGFESFINSQNLPTIRWTMESGVSFQYVMWSNNRLILQKVENGTTTTLCTWTGS